MRMLGATLAGFLCLLALGAPAVSAPPPMTFTLVNVEYEGTKMWLPGTMVVPKGVHITIKLINNVPSDPPEHGFAIAGYNIAEVVKRGEPKTIEFTADKAGSFPITCHLHPAHVGGQLVVLGQ